MHDASQVPLHDAAQVPPHVPLHEASQVGHPGQVHAVGQVHCSPMTVPFSFCDGVVVKLSMRKSSSSSLSFRMSPSGVWV
ncbi:MAG TPA: hypothetical protein VFS20_09640 [Longimicrobium sp.]|nr:hypothetical protein [Longimicrobium sp.]